MSKFGFEDPEADLARLDNRYKITVEFTVDAYSIDDAEADVKEIIQEGILALAQNEEDNGTIYDYDIVDSEPAEVE